MNISMYVSVWLNMSTGQYVIVNVSMSECQYGGQALQVSLWMGLSVTMLVWL